MLLNYIVTTYLLYYISMFYLQVGYGVGADRFQDPAHFLKNVITFVRSNDFWRDFFSVQSNETISLLYYGDYFFHPTKSRYIITLLILEIVTTILRDRIFHYSLTFTFWKLLHIKCLTIITWLLHYFTLLL